MRHASDSAHAWARNIKVRDARAKHVLRTVCLYVNEDGIAWPSVERLAEDTEQSPNTIRSRLRYLADIGVLARLPRWIDDHGKRNAEARGRRTTDELRLLFDVSQEQIDAAIEARPRRASHGEGSEQSSGDDDEIIEESTSENADPANLEGLPTPSGCEPPGLHLAEGLELSSEQDSPTQTLPHPEQAPASEASPPTGAEGEASTPQPLSEPVDSPDSPEMQKRWKRLCSTYPDGIIDPPQTETEFFKLTLAEADNCVKGAALYADRCKRRREKPKAAHLFIRKRTYSGLLAEKPNTKRSVNFTLVPIKSDTGRAVSNLYLMTHLGLPVRCHGEGGMECFSVPIKPDLQVSAFLNVPRRSQWEFYELHTPNAAAWRRFIEASTGKSLAVTTRPSSTRPGIYAPHPWPPRIDGTWSECPESPPSTGPPSVPKIPELTEDDIRVLTDQLTG